MTRTSLLFIASLLFGASLGAPLGGTAHAQLWIQSEDAGVYTPLAVLPGIADVTGIVFSDNDDGVATVTLPFEFRYLGRPFTSLRLGTNGLLVFGNGPFGGFSNWGIGTSASPNDMIAPWWDDLILPDAAGWADHGTLGAAPDRILVIELRGWERFPLANREEGSFQVWLYEGPGGRFEVRYDGVLSAAEGYTATAGWEGPDGDGEPFGAFRPCATSGSCTHVDYATMVGRVFRVEQPEGPELVGSVGAFPRGALPGGSATGPVIVRNLGTEGASQVVSNLYLSSDPVFDVADVLVGSFTLPLVAAGAALTHTATVTVPPGTAPGDFYLLLVVDAPNTIPEVSETNNVSAAPDRFATAHDLSLSALVFPAAANPGDPVTASFTVGNRGVPFVGQAVVELSASRDTLPDPLDALIAQVPVTLGGAVSEVVQVQVNLPALPPGRYYPIARVDPSGALPDLDRTNDLTVGAATFTSGPNLAPQALTLPPGAHPGAPLAIELVLRNEGVPHVGPVLVRVQASPDPILDVNDPLLGTQVVTLTGAATQTVNLSFPVPPLPLGRYYAFLRVDPANLIPEFDERDNLIMGAETFAIGPDFSAAALTVPAEGAPGQPFATTVRVGSVGAPFDGAVSYRLVLSLDQQLDAQDVALGSFSVTFAGEASREDSRSVAFPAVPPGAYWVLAEVNPGNLVPEASRLDNLRSSAARVSTGSDLRISRVVVSPNPVPWNGTLSVTFDLRTSGTPFTGQVGYRFFLSTDGVLDASDVPLLDGVVEVNGTLTTATATVGFGAVRPVIRPGSYRLLVAADPLNLIPETNEDNNVGASGSFAVRGTDVQAVAMSAPAVVFTGRPFEVQLTLRNGEPLPAEGFVYTYSVAPGGRFDQAVEVFRSQPLDLAGGEQLMRVDQLTLPASIAHGTHPLLVLLDPEQRLPEVSRANDLLASNPPITVMPLLPDLTARILSSSTVAAGGEDLAVTRVLENVGVAAAQSFEYAYYLSTDAVIGTGDLLLGTFTSQLDEGESEHGIDRVRLPSSVAPGVYHLGLIVDPQRRVPQVDVANDTARAPAPITVHEAGLFIATEVLPEATLGVRYEAALVVSGAPLPVTWSLVAGELPPGLLLEGATGFIAGTPAREGRFELRVRAAMPGAETERVLVLAVLPVTVPLAVASLVLPVATVERAYQAQLVAVGGLAPYRWSAVGPLPEGLSLDATGAVSGTPRAPGVESIAVRVRDERGAEATAELRLRILAEGQRLTILPAELPRGVVGEAYCDADPVRLAATGGFGALTWRALEALPEGLELSSEGALCGTPARAGSFSFVVRAQDAEGLSDSTRVYLDVVHGDAVVLRTRELPDGVLGRAYEARILAAGRGEISFSLAYGELPAGLSLAEDGQIRGTPSAAGSFAFVVRLSGDDGSERLGPLSIWVAETDPLAGGDGGCGCTTKQSGGAPEPVAALLVVLLLAGRRRRR